MKFKYISTLIIASLGIFSMACQDELDKYPVTEVYGDSFESESNIEAALFGSYQPLKWQAVDGIHVFPLMWQGLRADDLNSQWASNWGPGLEMDQFPISPTSASVQKLWSKWYTGIQRTNKTIEVAEAFEGWTTEGLQAQVIGEAKTLRAFYYFELLKSFGGVPLVLRTASANDIPEGVRATESEMYAQIDLDLTEALDGLKNKGEVTTGRITKGVAQTLLAKSKLYQKDYTNAAKYAQEVITGGLYQLEENFAHNFLLAYENGKESVLEIQYEDGFTSGNFEQEAQSSQGSAMWQMAYPWITGRYLSWSNFIPRGELLAQYDRATDKRFEATFMTEGSDISDNFPSLATAWAPDGVTSGHLTWMVDAGGGKLAAEDCHYTKKYLLDYDVVEGLLNVQQSPLNEKVIRYAEVLLIHAEASVMGGGGDGLSSLNQIRERAGLTALGSYTLEDIKLERRREFATEGWNRFSDLIRWNDAVSNIHMTAKGFTAGRDELLPIPQAEIDVVGAGVLTQNPNY